MQFIHYGSKQFNPNMFGTIKNLNSSKPSGGLWGSPIDSKYGWKEWCKEEDYCHDFSHFFTFQVQGNIHIIDSLEDLLVLPTVQDQYPDFEKCLRIGIDAVLLTVKGKCLTRFSYPISLYEWDCESIVVLNKSSIVI